MRRIHDKLAWMLGATLTLTVASAGFAQSKEEQSAREKVTKDTQQEVKEAREEAQKKIKEAQEESNKRIKDAQTKAPELEKKEYVRLMGERLERIDGKLDELRDKAKNAKGPQQQSLNSVVAQLTGKRETADTFLSQLKDAKPDGWQQTRASIEQAFKELESGLQSAASNLGH